MEIPIDLFKLVATYLVKPKMKLLDWIPIDKLEWHTIANNPNIIHFMKPIIHQVILKKFGNLLTSNNSNINKVYLIEDNVELIRLYSPYLSRYPNALHLLESYPDMIDWENLSRNPGALHLLEPVIQNSDIIDWEDLSSNPEALNLLECKEKNE